MTEYTPDEEHMEVAWIEYDDAATDINEAAAQFDRFLSRIRRDAAREALGSLQSFASECMDGGHGEIDHETFAGWHHTWAAAMQHRVTHYPHPEETP